MSGTYVEFHSVEKRFGNVQALKGISFSIAAGEVFGFIGPNGSGKTTTIRIMLDFYRPDRGEVRIFGKNPAVDFAAIGRHIGVMLEQPGLHEQLTAKEYLEFYAGLLGLRKPDAARRCADLLETVGLSQWADRLLRTYSKGMRQRTAFARALLNRPRLLVLDEPFDGIDAETRRDLLQLIPRVAREEGAAVFLTSHNLAEVEQLCNRVAVVKEGRILAWDSTPALRRMTSNRTVLVIRLGSPAPADVLQRALSGLRFQVEGDAVKVDLVDHQVDRDDVLRSLLNHRLSVASFHEEVMTLEDIYFTLTAKDGGNQ